MNTLKQKFLKESEAVSFDLKHRRTIAFNMSKYNAAFKTGKSRYENVELAKVKASAIKKDALYNLHDNLVLFEKLFTTRGGKVLWASDAEEAIAYVKEIVLKNDFKTLVKSKSMTTEEICFNEEMSRVGVESVETDLGEFIVQLAKEPPYHIVTPAMHKSRLDVAELFHKELATPLESTAEELTEYVRNLLRKKYTTADFGVTGANFIVADIGAVAITENEGNGLMSTSFPKVHIAIAGIEKVVSSYREISHMWPLLSAHGTGQKITGYSTLFSGPRQSGEVDGPDEMYVILLDNKRTEIYAQPVYQESLQCIRCGACLNACPIYNNVGGYTYNSTYSGPIGSVITPHLKDFNFSHLSFACTLCGKCTEVCPVKINLHDLLLENRREAVEKKDVKFSESIVFGSVLTFLKFRFLLDLFPASLKNMFLKFTASKLWGRWRSFPILKKSFASSFKDIPSR